MTNNKTTYRRLGDYIREVDVRNTDLKQMNYKFKDIIEEIDEFNSELKYGLDDIVGVTIEKGLIPTVANLSQTKLDGFYIVKPDTFIYNPRTHGVRLGMGYNDTDNVYITSWNNVAFRVKSKDIVLPGYLWLYFNRPEWDRHTNFLAWGSSTIVFAWRDFLDINIDLPSIEEQRRIVTRYQAIQNRIENNKKTIAKLEEAAQALYRKMFVDGIDVERLPEGWRMGTLGEVCSKIGSGSTPKGGKDSYLSEGISLIRSMNVFDSYFERDDLAHITEGQAKALDSVTVQDKDILLNITGASVGRCCMVPSDILPARVNQHVLIIRAKESIYQHFLLYQINSENTKRELLTASESGSTREALTKGEIEMQKILIPAKSDIERFSQIVEPLIKQTQILNIENLKMNEMLLVVMA